MTSTEYCNFSSSWTTKNNLKNLAIYSTDTDQTIENGLEDDYETWRAVECHKDAEDNVTSLVLTCSCKPHHNVSITAVDVISEARTIECYSDMDGYLTTSRGTLISSDNTDNNELTKKLYKCHLKFEEPVESVSFKYLGLDNRDSITLYKLHVHLVLKEEGHISSTIPGCVDMSKVKSYLNTMGTSMSDNALQMMNSVEQYQETQMKQTNGLQKLLSSSLSSLPASTGSGNGSNMLSGLLSMMTKLGSVSTDSLESNLPINPANQNSQNKQCDFSSGDSVNVLPSKTASPLDRLLAQSRSISNNEGHTEINGGHDPMMKMLQGICGKMSQVRMKEHSSKESKEKEYHDRLSDNKTEDATLDGALRVESSVTTENITQLQTTMEQMIKSSEERLMKYIDTSISSMETRLSDKLDNLILAVKATTNQPTVKTEPELD